MRERLMMKLMEAQGFVSGARMSLDLGISRGAVWKHIQVLRQEGFAIAASPRKGYRLLDVPDVLYAAVVNPLLTGGFGKPYHYRHSLTSTNDTAKALAHSGAPEGTVVVAEEQTGGRGRRGRFWHSPPGGLWFSLILRPKTPPAEINSLSLVLSLAAAEGLEQLPGISPSLKWPNDLLLGGRKVGGILTEISAEADQVHYAVAGIGINANFTSFPPEIEQTATSLQAHSGGAVCRPRLLSALLTALEDNYRRWCEKGFPPFRAAYKERFGLLGKTVSAATPTGTLNGLVRDVDGDGNLILTLRNGEEMRLSTGEITVRGEEH
jgi:BirA family biotin operon repressor/biotin-[acetyl-CoA-carboxylase] ligase